MNWNIAAEAISTVVLCIIWIYSRKGNPIPSLKNRLFQICFLTTFCAMTSNIISTLLIYSLCSSTLILTWIVTIIYFISTPLMGLAYYLYSIANIFEEKSSIKKYFFIGSIPGFIYAFMVLTNVFTLDLFNISLTDGYVQGQYRFITYVIFYLYCIISVVMVVLKGKHIQPSIRIILFSFPLIAALVVVLQFVFPTVILTGSAATCSLLLIYLYLQNKQMSIDYLTGIPNRNEFLKMLELCLKVESSFTILVVSLRGFKMINDTYGQHNGDIMLRTVSDYIRKNMYLKEDEFYRYSGDEFAILLKKSNESRVDEIAAGIFDRISYPWESKNCTCFLSVSMGIVKYPETANQMEGLINGIESSVFAAKTDSAYQNICYCTSELLEKVKRRQIVEEILKQKVENSDFEMYYQPILNVDMQKFVTAEALMRINSDRLGRLSPDEFIPVAEESGLIIDLTYLMIEKVGNVIKRLMNENIAIDAICVNFSALQFTQKDMLNRIVEITKKCDIPISKIKVEITESTLAENIGMTLGYINTLHDMGVKFSLDDFGTGYSNLTSVIGFPIDTVKLDKSLIWSGTEKNRFSIVVQNVARAFRELGVSVLAEGVETEEHRQFAEDSGCSLIQGFMYAKPMPEDEFVEFMKTNSHLKA